MSGTNQKRKYTTLSLSDKRDIKLIIFAEQQFMTFLYNCGKNWKIPEV